MYEKTVTMWSTPNAPLILGDIRQILHTHRARLRDNVKRKKSAVKRTSERKTKNRGKNRKHDREKRRDMTKKVRRENGK